MPLADRADCEASCSRDGHAQYFVVCGKPCPEQTLCKMLDRRRPRFETAFAENPIFRVVRAVAISYEHWPSIVILLSPSHCQS